MDKRILLIDFDPVAAELTGALLATRGIPFTLARNHAELDRALAAGPPALVVIDPARPDENEGMRLCASVAERLGPAGKVPIILASRSLHGARWKALARDAGAELFLERPKDDRLLLAAAERALSQAGDAPAPPQAVGTAVPDAARTAAPSTPGPSTTAVSQRTPPPPENELENMVDQMFAQWFAEGEGPAPSAPVQPPAPALAPAATRTSAAAAAVLEAPAAVAADVDRAPTGSARPSVPAAAPSAAAPTFAPQVVASAAPAAPRPAGSTGPTGPMAVAARPAPTGPAVASARPAPAARARPVAAPLAAPVPLAATAAQVAPAAPGTNLVRPLAIAAAVALIGLGVGFVVLQKAGGPEETAAETVVSAPRETPPPADQQPTGDAATVGSAAAAPSGTTTNPPVPAAKLAPERPAVAPPLSAKALPRTESPIQDVASVRPAPATPPPPTPPPAASPSTAAAPVVATAPAEATDRAVPYPEPEAEFIPDLAPDGTLPAAEVAGDATLARYVGPELIASTRATPAFPPGARQMRMSGQVKLQVKVRADGSVGAVTVLSEPKPAVGFGKAAETAVRQWRYRPATMGSRAVESEIVVVVNFAGD